MYAIVDIAGQQFRVEKDQKIYVHRIEGEAGSKVDFDKVLLIDNNKNIVVGNPLIKGAMVYASILDHLKGDKVLVFKKKRREGYRKKNGHRQYLTQIVIEDIIEIGAKARVAVKEAKPVEVKESKKAPAKEVKAAEEIIHKEAPVKEVKKKAETPKVEAKTETKKAVKKPASKTAEVKKSVTKPATKSNTVEKKAVEKKTTTTKKTVSKKSGK
jgi:large subunit ribosomal protein L21